jgi:hypothetical protein
MTKTVIRGLQQEKVNANDVLQNAINAIQKTETKYKDRWLQAVRKAGQIFVSNDQILIADMHRKLNTYQTSATSCNCTAAHSNNPCYHRAYVLLRMRYAEANI